ncbi:hypothetical protein BGZ60DRAFT_395255 [Tricladium varicosporioides]|nr:hypothetical protein BGZ60DRAFT_395255 [Hymenoscyphus varicosporioides]
MHLRQSYHSFSHLFLTQPASPQFHLKTPRPSICIIPNNLPPSSPEFSPKPNKPAFVFQTSTHRSSPRHFHLKFFLHCPKILLDLLLLRASTYSNTDVSLRADVICTHKHNL